MEVKVASIRKNVPNRRLMVYMRTTVTVVMMMMTTTMMTTLVLGPMLGMEVIMVVALRYVGYLKLERTSYS